MDAEAWIALAGGTAGGGAIGTGITATLNYFRDRQKQTSVDRHDATQQASDDREKVTEVLIKRIETVETAIASCHDQHNQCQRDRLEDAIKFQKDRLEDAVRVAHLEGEVASLTTLVGKKIEPHISIHSGEKQIETIGFELPEDEHHAKGN